MEPVVVGWALTTICRHSHSRRRKLNHSRPLSKAPPPRRPLRRRRRMALNLTSPVREVRLRCSLALSQSRRLWSSPPGRREVGPGSTRRRRRTKVVVGRRRLLLLHLLFPFLLRLPLLLPRTRRGTDFLVVRLLLLILYLPRISSWLRLVGAWKVPIFFCGFVLVILNSGEFECCAPDFIYFLLFLRNLRCVALCSS